MSTFVFAIEGDENFSAYGVICIASSWLRRALTMMIAQCYSSLQNLIALMVTLMHGERVGAHALKVERVFAAQRSRFNRLLGLQGTPRARVKPVEMAPESLSRSRVAGMALADVGPGADARRPALTPLS